MQRDLRKGAFQDYQSARQHAAETKYEAINHLDQYLEEFTRNMEARGTKVHWASTEEQAREIIVGIVRAKKARSIIKSKAMTAEEIHLNAALEAAAFQVVESDLGEYIVQLRKEAPYHIVFPAMHLTRGEISELFEKELGSAPTNDPEELTMIARRALRDQYVTADIGITGANFAIAETGMISITENEGNARLTAALPKTMITLLGIEKILPKFEDLALFLPLLATSGAGQAITCYNSMYSGPRQPGECDGPEEYHVVLLDNNRTKLLADAEQRDAFALYPLWGLPECLPHLQERGWAYLWHHVLGADRFRHHAASARAEELEAPFLCLQPLRRLYGGLPGEDRPAPSPAAKPAQCRRASADLVEKWSFKLLARVLNNPGIYAAAKRFGWLGQFFHPLIRGTKLDPAQAWTKTRDLPPVAAVTFKDYWRNRK